MLDAVQPHCPMRAAYPMAASHVTHADSVLFLAEPEPDTTVACWKRHDNARRETRREQAVRRDGALSKEAIARVAISTLHP